VTVAPAENDANADSESYDKGAKRFDLLVNATPTGLFPRAEQAIADHPRFFHLFDAAMDLVYNPAQTRLLFLAHLAGCATISGRKMLERQAAHSRKIWVREFRAQEKLRE
jgi:shikimate dehydrogenase